MVNNPRQRLVNTPTAIGSTRKKIVLLLPTVTFIFLTGVFTGAHLSTLGTNICGNNYLDIFVPQDQPTKSFHEKVKEFQTAFKVGNSDKISRHGYHWFYGPILDEFRHRPNLSMLEIGAEFGKSAIGWANYFKHNINIDLYTYNGKDDRMMAFEFECPTKDCDEKVHLFHGDQANTDQLDEMISKRSDGWDIIIDDASHVPYHQIITFEHMWKAVKPGGLYIVEDVETSYYPKTDIYGYNFEAGILAPPPHNSVNRFKQYIDIVNRGYFGPRGRDFSYFTGDNAIMEIGFTSNIVYIRKALADDQLDGDGKPLSSYPFEPVELEGREDMLKGLNEAKDIFKKQSRDLNEWKTAPSIVKAQK